MQAGVAGDSSVVFPHTPRPVVVARGKVFSGATFAPVLCGGGCPFSAAPLCPLLPSVVVWSSSCADICRSISKSACVMMLPFFSLSLCPFSGVITKQ